MKQLNTYIIEKLRINKDSNKKMSESDLNTVCSLITMICDIKLNDSSNIGICNAIEDWIIENNIDSIDKVNCYAEYKNLKSVMDGDRYDRLEKEDLLKFVKNRPGKVKQFANYIEEGNGNNYLKAKNTRHSYYLGEVHVYINTLIFVIRASNTYFIFEPK